jgi:flagellar motor protein MotB
VMIIGHSDQLPIQESKSCVRRFKNNLMLSEARARSAGGHLNKVLSAQGISITIKTSGLGASSPLEDCAHYQGKDQRRCHSKNRRIDARIVNGSNLNFNTQSCTL